LLQFNLKAVYAKGEAWKLKLDEKFHLLESPQLIQAEGMVSGHLERKVF